MDRDPDISQLDPNHPDYDMGVATDVYGAIAKDLEQDEVSFEEAQAYIAEFGWP